MKLLEPIPGFLQESDSVYRAGAETLRIPSRNTKPFPDPLQPAPSDHRTWITIVFHFVLMPGKAALLLSYAGFDCSGDAGGDDQKNGLVAKW